MANDDLAYGTSGALFENARKRREAAAKSPLADDRKGCFQKKNEARQKALIASDTQGQREQARENQRVRWTHRNDAPRTSGGIAAGTELCQLKAAERVFTHNQSHSAPPPDPIALKAHVLLWRSETPEGRAFIATPYNIEVLSNSIQHHLGIGWPINIEMITRSHRFALEGNHYDLRQRDADGNIVVRRGDKPFGGSAPVPLAPFIWPDERQAADAEALQLEIEKALAERNEAQSRPFDELQQDVRKNFKAPKPGGPNLDRS